MLVGLAIGWVVLSASLYMFLYLTAKESPHDECFECNSPECAECSHLHAATENSQKRAA